MRRHLGQNAVQAQRGRVSAVSWQTQGGAGGLRQGAGEQGSGQARGVVWCFWQGEWPWPRGKPNEGITASREDAVPTLRHLKQAAGGQLPGHGLCQSRGALSLLPCCPAPSLGSWEKRRARQSLQWTGC